MHAGTRPSGTRAPTTGSPTPHRSGRSHRAGRPRRMFYGNRGSGRLPLEVESLIPESSPMKDCARRDRFLRQPSLRLARRYADRAARRQGRQRLGQHLRRPVPRTPTTTVDGTPARRGRATWVVSMGGSRPDQRGRADRVPDGRDGTHSPGPWYPTTSRWSRRCP